MWCVVFRMVCVLVSEFPNSTGRWVFQWKLLSSSWEELSSRTAGWPCNTVQGGCNFWVCGWNAVVWPFKWNFSSITFTMSCLFFSILHREIWNFCWILTLATPGSERATSFSQLTTHLPSKFLDILFNISIHHHLVLWKIQM